MSDRETLTLLVHGEAKVGKTWVADTAPEPRLVLDAEGGNRFTKSKKIYWDPESEEPPKADGSWETCIVIVRSFQTLELVMQWLNSGKHDFVSATMDSLTEIQKRCLDEIAGTNQPDQQAWGALLRKMEGLVREFRDLTTHPTKPLKVVTLLAMTSHRDGRFRPHVQGQLVTTLPYFIDVIGYMYTTRDEAGEHRQMLVHSHNDYVAGDRTDRLPSVMQDPTIDQMLDIIYNGQEA